MDTRQIKNVLEAYLRDKTKWVTQSTITHDTGLKGREVRAACQDYPATFLGSTDGYKLVDNAYVWEIQHGVSTLLSRAQKIIHRADHLSRRVM